MRNQTSPERQGWTKPQLVRVGNVRDVAGSGIFRDQGGPKNSRNRS